VAGPAKKNMEGIKRLLPSLFRFEEVVAPWLAAQIHHRHEVVRIANPTGEHSRSHDDSPEVF